MTLRVPWKELKFNNTHWDLILFFCYLCLCLKYSSMTGFWWMRRLSSCLLSAYRNLKENCKLTKMPLHKMISKAFANSVKPGFTLQSSAGPGNHSFFLRTNSNHFLTKKLNLSISWLFSQFLAGTNLVALQMYFGISKSSNLQAL